MTGDALFPDEGLRVAAVEDAGEQLTAGERLRRRQAARIAAGSGRRRTTTGAGPRPWTALRASNGEASDVRAWWPACVDYQACEAAS